MTESDPTSPAADLPHRLTPPQRGRDVPPSPTHGGQEIRITIDSQGSRPLTITLRQPEQNLTHARPAEGHASAAQPQAHDISHSHVAGVSVKQPDANQQVVPSTTLALNHLFQSKGEQMELAEKRFTIHESLDQAMQQAFAPMMQSIDPQVYQQATRVVHQVMAELLAGNILMAVPMEDIIQVRDAMVDTAAMAVKNYEGKEPFNVQSLRRTLETHPLVIDFKQMHRPAHSHETTMQYHPRTGVESRTVFGANVSHHGRVEEYQRGRMADATVDY